jgi:probable F420-dependent oxidoreductase
MRIAAKLPNRQALRDPADLRQAIQGIETLGFDVLSIDDHVSVTDPARLDDPAMFDVMAAEHEVLTTLAWASAFTNTIRFRSGILILPQRQTVLVARQTAEVDVLSGGRLDLGIGIGWNRDEFAALGERFETRGRRAEAQIDVLRKLWTAPFVDHADEWHGLEGTGVLPRPVQRPIPIWIGASGEPAVRRAARIADGFIPLGRIGRGGEAQVAIYQDELDLIGRSLSEAPIEGWIDLLPEDPERWRREAERWAELGATTITLVPPDDEGETVDSHLSRFERALHALCSDVG